MLKNLWKSSVDLWQSLGGLWNSLEIFESVWVIVGNLQIYITYLWRVWANFDHLWNTSDDHWQFCVQTRHEILTQKFSVSYHFPWLLDTEMKKSYPLNLKPLALTSLTCVNPGYCFDCCPSASERPEDRHQGFCWFHAKAVNCQRACAKFEGESGLHKESLWGELYIVTCYLLPTCILLVPLGT